MGGNIGIIVKKSDKEQIPMDRWTNVMPYHFSQINLYQGNLEQWYDEFTQSWQNMKNDYERNKDTGNYEENMTPVYFPHTLNVPSEYGLIAVDMVNKKIYSSQDYCTIGALNIHRYYNDHDEQEKLREFFENGYIKELHYYIPDINNPNAQYIEQSTDISSLSWKDLALFLDEAKKSEKQKFISEGFAIKFTHPLLSHISSESFSIYNASLPINSGWEFIVYHDRSLGLLKIKKEMEKDGFIFTTEDNYGWQEYLSYSWYNEDINDLKNDAKFLEFSQLYKELFNEQFIPQKEEDKNLKLK